MLSAHFRGNAEFSERSCLKKMFDDYYAGIATQYGVDENEVKREISHALSESKILRERREKGLFQDLEDSEKLDMTLLLLSLLSYNEFIKANLELQENMYKEDSVKSGRGIGKQARFA